MTNKQLIIKEFRRIKKLGFVKSRRRSNTGIGKTFEDYIGVEENNIDKPDFAGYEIKAHRDISSSYVTLFTKAPSFPKGANAYLKDTYGTPYENNPKLKRIHTSLFATQANSYGNKYAFKLINDRQEKKLYIGVYSLKSKKLIDISCGYTYEDLKKVLNRKLKSLFYVVANTKTDSKGKESFHFTKAYIYETPSFTKFLNMIDKGFIMYDIRIGSYKSGKNIGKTHDHGSGFRILEKNLKKLYSVSESIE
jgi:hypothetical protein